MKKSIQLDVPYLEKAPALDDVGKQTLVETLLVSASHIDEYNPDSLVETTVNLCRNLVGISKLDDFCNLTISDLPNVPVEFRTAITENRYSLAITNTKVVVSVGN